MSKEKEVRFKPTKPLPLSGVVSFEKGDIAYDYARRLRSFYDTARSRLPSVDIDGSSVEVSLDQLAELRECVGMMHEYLAALHEAAIAKARAES